MAEQTTWEPVGSLRMAEGNNPVGKLWIPVDVVLDGSKVLAMTKTTREDGIVDTNITQIGIAQPTKAGNKILINAFGTTMICDKIALESLKARKPGGISSVSVATPVPLNNTPTGVRSGIKNTTAY